MNFLLLLLFFNKTVSNGISNKNYQLANNSIYNKNSSFHAEIEKDSIYIRYKLLK